MKRFALTLIFICAIEGSARAYSPIPIPDMNYTDLHLAAKNCDVEKERAALAALPPADRKAEINRLDREGYTPLAYAAQNGCMEIVKLLVESGAVVDATEKYSRWTPLLRAAQNRRADTVRYLLEHRANVNAKAGYGQTPLTEAISGSVFFHDVSKEDRDETIRALLAAGADVNLPGRYGRTPLITAVFQGAVDLVRLLIGKGADLSAKDEEGKTALDYAEKRDEREIKDILKNKGRW